MITPKHHQQCKIINHKYQNNKMSEANHTHVAYKTQVFKEEIAKLDEEVKELEDTQTEISGRGGVDTEKIMMEAFSKVIADKLKKHAFA